LFDEPEDDPSRLLFELDELLLDEVEGEEYLVLVDFAVSLLSTLLSVTLLVSVSLLTFMVLPMVMDFSLVTVFRVLTVVDTD